MMEAEMIIISMSILPQTNWDSASVKEDNRLLYFIIIWYIKSIFNLSTDKLGLFLRQRAKEQGGLQLGTYHYLTAGDHNHHQTHT